LTDSETYLQRVGAIHAALGISKNYIQQCLLPLCEEPPILVATELDYYERPQQLTPQALEAWQAMKQSAADQGVSLFLISAFRSLQYQQDLISRKLAKGSSLEQILKVNAAPGFSEHHTGRAIDIGSDAATILQEAFEETTAFQWLMGNARRFGFSLSYPRGNPHGIDYEPWHWCFSGARVTEREA